jgi:3-hydroxyisobutyrate dehydrogenase
MVAIELSQKALEKGMTYIDAPVSGGVTGAQAGTLTFMVGASDEKTFNLSKEYLSSMGKSFFNCGKPGAGQIAKLCNNMALAI